MEKFSQRESILLGYSPQSSLMKSGSSASTPSDVDFHDVFGGPPRRSSTQEMRYSFNDVAVTKSPKGDDDDDDSLSGKPVFGEDSQNTRRRRTHSDDFFDDIFKGNNNSGACSPRRLQRDPYSSSSPASRPESSLPTPFRFSHYFFCYRNQIVSSLFSILYQLSCCWIADKKIESRLC